MTFLPAGLRGGGGGFRRPPAVAAAVGRLSRAPARRLGRAAASTAAATTVAAVLLWLSDWRGGGAGSSSSSSSSSSPPSLLPPPPPPVGAAGGAGGGGGHAAAAWQDQSAGGRLAGATARLAAGEPPPAAAFGSCVSPPADGRAAGAVAAVGIVDALGGGGCCTLLPPRLGAGAVAAAAAAAAGVTAFHGSLVTPPDAVEVARRASVHDPPDEDTLFSVVDTYKERLYTPARGGHGLPRAQWLGPWATRWNASAALGLDALGVVLAARRVAAAVAAGDPAGDPDLPRRSAAAAGSLGGGGGGGGGPPAVTLSALTIPHTHYRLNAAGGELWVFDVDAVAGSAAAPVAAAVAAPPPSSLAAVRAAAAAGGRPPPVTPLPPRTPVAWKVVVARQLGATGGCTVEAIPRAMGTPLTLVVPYSGRPGHLATYLATFRRLRLVDPALSLVIVTLAAEHGAVENLVKDARLPRSPPPPAFADVGMGAAATGATSTITTTTAATAAAGRGGDGRGATAGGGTVGGTPGGPRGSVGGLPATNGVTVLTTAGDRTGAFSRSVAIREAVRLLPFTGLFFVTDVDLDVKGGALRNCRANALLGGQAWFPIFWSYYAATHAALTASSGYWRTSSYGPVCVHRADWEAVGGFGGDEERRYAGWGSEDVDLYNAFRDHPSVAVMRGLEPGLAHAWHSKACAHNAAYDACARTVAMSMASAERLASIVVKAGVDVAAELGVTPETGGGMG